MPAFAAILGIGGALIAFAVAFQLFFRYQYLENDGALWRIDRLTQEICRVSVGGARCEPDSQGAPAASKFSTSTSTSTSISTSLSAKLALPKRKR